MILYLMILAIMTTGATALAYIAIQISLQDKRLSIYDARGFYMVALVFITFLLTSLAYYWGDSRFDTAADGVSQPVVGVLFALCCSLAGLAFGLVRLKEIDPFE